jgi:serine/threonine protein kinase
VKVMRTGDEERFIAAQMEYELMKKLDHRNIVKAEDIYLERESGCIYTVMEMIDGKEMFEMISEIGAYSGKYHESNV